MRCCLVRLSSVCWDSFISEARLLFRRCECSLPRPFLPFAAHRFQLSQLIWLALFHPFTKSTGVCTICLSVSYGIPICISMFRRRALMVNAPYSLGKFGYVINGITFCWICLATVLFCMPTTESVTAETMK